MFTRNGTGKRTESDATTETWQRYERGVSYHERNNLYAQTDKNHRYFAGDQLARRVFGKHFAGTI